MDTLRRIDFQRAIDTIQHGIAVLDSDLRILALNRYLEVLSGFSAEAVQGIYFDHVIRSNLSQKTNGLRNVFEKDDPFVVEGDIIDHRRKKLPVRFTFSSLVDQSARQLGVMVIIEDISFLHNLDSKIHGKSVFEGLIGHSPQMQKVFDLLPVIARTEATALITGETGTGKDLVAEAIHNASPRAGQPFIKVNCGALPETLLESELFGHCRGAFTGADKDKPGMFRLANGGTIFLTEIGDLSLPLQVKLLTVLDDKAFFPLGGTKKVRVDVRVITATHRDLRELVGLKKFREDLFYRLNVLRLHLPPLREREGDIRLLIDYFLNKFNASMKRNIKGFDQASLGLLLEYAYPGNARELSNIVEYAVTICQADRIGIDQLPAYLLTAGPRQVGRSLFNGKSGESAGSAEIVRAAVGAGLEQQEGWNEVEKRMIIEALVETRGKRAQAAKILGWGRSTLWRKLKQHGLA